MKPMIPFFLCFLFFLPSCNTKSPLEKKALIHQDHITVSGAFALTPLMQQWVIEFRKTHPGVNFTITSNGSDQGQSDVLNGKVDMGMISAEIPRGLDTNFTIIPVARLGVVPIISSKNPYLNEIAQRGISREVLISLFTGQKPKTWGDLFGKPAKDPVNIYIRADSSGATKILSKYLWIEPYELKGKAVNGETKLIDAVRNDPFALSYCNFVYALDSSSKQFSGDIVVLPIDFNQNGIIDGKEKIFDNATHLQRAMWLGKFPCSMIRTLYLVTKNNPQSAEVTEFLYWVINEGQDMVARDGYIELHSGELQFLKIALKAESN